MGREDSVYRLLQDIVAEHISQIALPEIGIVQSVDKDSYTVVAKLVYDEVVSAPLRVAESFTGNGFGITNLPNIGDEVVVVFQGGRPNDGYVIGRLYGDDIPPSFNIKDYQLQHKSGSKVTLKDNGDVELSVKNAGTATLKADGSVEAIAKGGAKIVLSPNKDITITGANGRNIQLDQTGKFLTNTGLDFTSEALLLAVNFLTKYDAHTHLVTTAPGTTSIPVIPLSSFPGLKTDGT